MNPNASTPLRTSKRLRAIKKSQKRRARRHQAVIQSLRKSPGLTPMLYLLSPGKYGDLLYGSLQRKRQIVKEINAMLGRLEAGQDAPNPIPGGSSKFESELKPPTHEVINKNGRWVRRRREGFKLWN